MCLMKNKEYFLPISLKKHVVDADQNRLADAILMSLHTISFIKI